MSIETFGDLKQAINNDLNRDDLVDVVADYVEAVIQKYQKSFFYETDQTDTMPTVVGTAYYELPGDMIAVDRIRLDQSGVWQRVSKVDYKELLEMDTLVNPTLTVPSLWAPYDKGFRLFNVPDKIYTLELTGSGRIPVPDLDTDSNFWTQDAADMIRCATLARIYRVRIKNYEAARECQAEAEDYRLALKQETFHRSATRVIAAHW